MIQRPDRASHSTALREVQFIEKILLGIKWRLFSIGSDTDIITVRLEYMRFGVVPPVDIENPFELSFYGWFENGKHNFDAVIQIAGHPVGTRQIHFFIARVFEIDNSGMF